MENKNYTHISKQDITLKELITILQSLDIQGYGDKIVTICGDSSCNIYIHPLYNNIIIIDYNENLFNDEE